MRPWQGPDIEHRLVDERLHARPSGYPAKLQESRLSGYLVEDGKRLFNPYGVMVNPARQPHVKVQLAQAFADWIVSAADQAWSRITR